MTARFILENIFLMIKKLVTIEEFPYIEDCCRNEERREKYKAQEIHIIMKRERIVTFTMLKHKTDIMITIRSNVGKVIYYTSQNL